MLELKQKNLLVTATEVLALHTTPLLIVPAEGDDVMLIPVLARVYKPAGVAYENVGAGDDIQIIHDTGNPWLVVESTGLLNQAGPVTWVTRGPCTVSSLFPQYGPVFNQGEGLYVKLGGAVEAGDAPLYVSVWYYAVPTGPGF